MSKKRRAKKPYNPIKAKSAGLERQLKKIWLARTWNNAELLRGGINYDAPECDQLCNFLLNRPHKWTVLLASFQRNEKGESWTDFQEIKITDPVLPCNIKQCMTQELRALHESRNPKYTIGTGWYAVPTDQHDLMTETESIEEIFRINGAFGNPEANADICGM